MSSFWKIETRPSWRDYAIAILSALLCPILRFALDSLAYQRLAKWVIVAKYQLRGRTGASKRSLKFRESAWKLTYYGLCVLVALLVTYKEPWFMNTCAFWPGWPHQTLKFQLKLFYMCQCGFYIYSVVALMIWETPRKDFSVMMSHHLITIWLISYSYNIRSFRVGSIVLALHDVNDVLLESAKLCKYSNKELGASIFFGLFVLSWILLRLIYFPFWIIKSTSYEVVTYVDKKNVIHTVHYYVFNTLLVTLLIIHMYWWILMCRMVFKQFQMRGKIPDDVRSDSEDDKPS